MIYLSGFKTIFPSSTVICIALCLSKSNILQMSGGSVILNWPALDLLNLHIKTILSPILYPSYYHINDNISSICLANLLVYKWIVGRSIFFSYSFLRVALKKSC